MAAFDVTTKPTSLSLKPGSTGRIIVVVSNRLGRRVMGSVEGVMTPASAAGWVVPPPDAQQPYPADPAATVTHEFKIAVPEDAPAQVAQFRATARDVLLPDDTRSDGPTVAISVTGDGPPPPPHRRWWLWVILAVVGLAAVGVVLWLLFRPHKKVVPSVLGKPQSEAITTLKDAGFDSVFVKDTVGGEVKDTHTVMRQEPEADTEMPKAEKEEQLLAGIVVSRPPGKVPIVVRMSQAEATSILGAAGFSPIDAKDTIIRYKSKTGFLGRLGEIGINQVAKQLPASGTELPRGEMVGKTPATIWIRRAPPAVPNVVGKTPPEATAALTAAGFKPVNVKDTIDDNALMNVVVRQQPAAGGEQPSGSMLGNTAATIVVSRAPTLVPAVIGVTKAEAKTRLTNAGLQPGSISADYTTSSFFDRRVVSSSPEAGRTVPRGSSVNLTIRVHFPFPSICKSNPDACPKP
jgi:beta-lactam-binding protein with PASTA domain